MIGALIAKYKINHAYDALNRRDFEAFLSDWRDDCTFVYPGNLPVSGKFEGKDAITKWFKNFFDQFPKLTLTSEKFKTAWGVTETKSVETEVEENIPDTSKFIGNTGTLVFHSSDCKYSKSKKCTADFNTKEEAIQEGYKPCGTCNP